MGHEETKTGLPFTGEDAARLMIYLSGTEGGFGEGASICGAFPFLKAV